MYAIFKDLENTAGEFQVYHRLPENWRSKIDQSLIMNFRKGADIEMLDREGFKLVVEEVLEADHRYGPVIWEEANNRFLRTVVSIYDGITLNQYKKQSAKGILIEINELMQDARDAIESMSADGTLGLDVGKATTLLAAMRTKRKAFLNLVINASTYAEVDAAIATARTQIDNIEKYSILTDFIRE